MKKRLLISIITSIMAVLMIATPALAADPTVVDVDWDGSGSVVGVVTTGDDAEASFGSTGNYQIGEFHAVDNNDNPYTYGVDGCTFSLDTSITGGGAAQLTVNRNDSKTSYCQPGQQSYTYVSTDDGNATLQNKVSTNYASMKDCNYGWNASNHITVDNATNFILTRWMDADISNVNSLNFAGLSAAGSGSANLDCMSSEAGSGVRLGWGCGCFTNADFTATGTGTFNQQATGDTESTTAMAPGMTGANSFSFLAGWTNGTFNVSDYSTTAK